MSISTARAGCGDRSRRVWPFTRAAVAAADINRGLATSSGERHTHVRLFGHRGTMPIKEMRDEATPDAIAAFVLAHIQGAAQAVRGQDIEGVIRCLEPVMNLRLAE